MRLNLTTVELSKLKKAKLSTAVFMIFFLCHCAVQKRFEPVPRTYLSDVPIEERIENLPFQHSWVSPHLKNNKVAHSTIFIKPIRVDLLPLNTWGTSRSTVISSKEDYINEAKEIAKHFRAQLWDKIRFHDTQRFRVVPTPTPKSLILDIALTELVFSHPVARAGSLAAPIPGTGAALSAISDPHVSFAIRVADAQSGKLIATAADRKFSPTRLLDFNKLTVTSSPREIVQNWSHELADSFQLGRFQKIESRGDWALLPW